MKRARLSLEKDLREKEADEVFRAQIRDEEDVELRSEELQRKQHSLDSELRKRTLKWDELGLVCAAGAKISPPPPTPLKASPLITEC